jgi:hypothetical protein
MCVMLLEDLVDLSHLAVIIFTVVLGILLLFPVAIPIFLTISEGESGTEQVPLLIEEGKQEAGRFRSNFFWQFKLSCRL